MKHEPVCKKKTYGEIKKSIFAVFVLTLLFFWPGMMTHAEYRSYTVVGTSNYLALRNAKAYDASNEIGRLANGETVDLLDSSDGTYWYVFAPSLQMKGYVNKNYLVETSIPSFGCNKPLYTVTGTSNYLALRNAKAYDASNEIGRLNNGETVVVTDKADAQYWYVYAPSLKRSGYVNKDYLTASASSGNCPTPLLLVYTVSGTSNYLALRTEKAYDAANEIGRLNNGEIVEMLDNSDDEYWYVYAPSLQKYGYVNCNYLK